MTRTLRHCTAILAALLFAGFTIQHASAQSPGSIVSAETRARAAEKLDLAEAALARGDLKTAWQATEAAAQAPTKFHGRGLANISSRELGDELYGRIFRLRRSMRTELGRKAESEGLLFDNPGHGEMREPWRWDSRDALTWYLGAPDPDAVLRLLGAAPADRRIITRMFGSYSVSDEGKIVYGAGRAGSGVAMGHEPLWDRYRPIPEELDVQQRFEQEVIPAVLTRIRKEAGELLAREENLHDAPPSEMEENMLYMSSDMAAFSESMTGFREEQAPPEILLLLERVDDSKELLEDAKAWLRSIPEARETDGQFGTVGRGGRRVVPVVERATARAQELMAIGRDTEVPVMTRADAYEGAQDYFYIANARERAEMAAERRSALQPAIDEYLARRNAAKDAAQEKFTEQAAEMEQAMKDMEKTEEEKKAFKEEADALEDELGF